MMNDINEKLISRIIELEFEITTEILSGHKPFIGDHLETKRSEVNTLRCLLYGSESIFCKKIAGEKK